jgi:SAM-dependent methyltransferase
VTTIEPTANGDNSELSSPSFRNTSGRPLSDGHWLQAHHAAKLPERTAFAKRLAALAPRRLVDLGCAGGLWLDLLNGIMRADCEFVGIDSDSAALEEARRRSGSWSRPAHFLELDLEDEPDDIPESDLLLAFNVFPYLENPLGLIESLRARNAVSELAVRQYDGGTLRIGPMSSADRLLIDTSLHASTGSSTQFRHYDLDRTFEILLELKGVSTEIAFETTQRLAPFPQNFIEYFDGTVEWMHDHISDDARERLSQFLASHPSAGESLYFLEVDLVGILSLEPRRSSRGLEMPPATGAQTAP